MMRHEALAVLKLDRDATPEQIKAAYRKAALRYHPDKGGSREDWDTLQEAYKRLVNPSLDNDVERSTPFWG